MKNKTLIYQLFIGTPNPGYECCLSSVKAYAAKIGADYYLHTAKLSDLPVYFEKMYLVDKLSDYDRVCYIDADILITPNAKNIFEEYPYQNCLWAYDENDVTAHMDRDPFIKELKPVTPWSKNSKGKFCYFNTGVMIFSKPLLYSFIKMFSFEVIPQGPRVGVFGEQTFYNYWAQYYGIPVISIDHSFNRMDLGNYDPKCERYKANFIHYAGPCKYGLDKYQTMVEDYNNLYGKNS